MRLKMLMLIGSLLSLSGFLWVRSETESQVRNDFLVSSTGRVRSVQKELEDNAGILRLLRAYFESSKDDGPAAFDRFASQTMLEHRGLRSLEWAPRVRDPDRQRFEAHMAAESPGAAGILTASPNGKLRSTVLRKIRPTL